MARKKNKLNARSPERLEIIQEYIQGKIKAPVDLVTSNTATFIFKARDKEMVIKVTDPYKIEFCQCYANELQEQQDTRLTYAEREIDILKNIRKEGKNNNIVKILTEKDGVHGFGKGSPDGGRTQIVWYAMEALRSVGDSENNYKLSPEAEILSLGIQMAKAIEDMEEMDIANRDIKPSNIMRVKNEANDVPFYNTYKLIDFGIGRNEMANITILATGNMGTLGYIDPEIIGGRNTTYNSVRTDLYLLSISLYEYINGGLPKPYRVEYVEKQDAEGNNPESFAISYDKAYEKPNREDLIVCDALKQFVVDNTKCYGMQRPEETRTPSGYRKKLVDIAKARGEEAKKEGKWEEAMQYFLTIERNCNDVDSNTLQSFVFVLLHQEDKNIHDFAHKLAFEILSSKVKAEDRLPENTLVLAEMYKQKFDNTKNRTYLEKAYRLYEESIKIHYYPPRSIYKEVCDLLGRTSYFDEKNEKTKLNNIQDDNKTKEKEIVHKKDDKTIVGPTYFWPNWLFVIGLFIVFCDNYINYSFSLLGKLYLIERHKEILSDPRYSTALFCLGLTLIAIAMFLGIYQQIKFGKKQKIPTKRFSSIFYSCLVGVSMVAIQFYFVVKIEGIAVLGFLVFLLVLSMKMATITDDVEIPRSMHIVIQILSLNVNVIFVYEVTKYSSITMLFDNPVKSILFIVIITIWDFSYAALYNNRRYTSPWLLWTTWLIMPLALVAYMQYFGFSAFVLSLITLILLILFDINSFWKKRQSNNNATTPRVICFKIIEVIALCLFLITCAQFAFANISGIQAYYAGEEEKALNECSIASSMDYGNKKAVLIAGSILDCSIDNQNITRDASTLSSIGDAYKALGDNCKSCENSNQIVQLREKYYQEARKNYEIELNECLKSNKSERKNYKETISKCEKIKDVVGGYSGMTNEELEYMGIAYYAQNQYNDAISAFKYLKDNVGGYKKMPPKCLQYMGYAYLKLEKYNDSLKCLNQCLKRKDEYEKNIISNIKSWIGIDYWRENQAKKAYKYIKEAADAGDENGLYWLGLMYEYGYYVEQSNVKAKWYMVRAARQGNEYAEEKIKELE